MNGLCVTQMKHLREMAELQFQKDLMVERKEVRFCLASTGSLMPSCCNRNHWGTDVFFACWLMCVVFFKASMMCISRRLLTPLMMPPSRSPPAVPCSDIKIHYSWPP